MQVHREPQVAAAIQAAMDRRLTSSSSRPCYMVWGASIGWLALYAALTHSSWSVVGVELLPVLVQVAQHMAQAAGLTGEQPSAQTLLSSASRRRVHLVPVTLLIAAATGCRFCMSDAKAACSSAAETPLARHDA